MSMTTCGRCGEYIDSDDDPGCFITMNGADRIRCEWCRDDLELLGWSNPSEDGLTWVRATTTATPQTSFGNNSVKQSNT